MRTSVLTAVVLGAALVAACTAAYAPGAGVTSGLSSTPSGQPASGAAEPPTAGVASVSKSSPSPEAAEVMKLCGVDAYGADRVVGMGQVASARDVAKYVEVYGVEPELNTTSPAWVVAFKGRIDLGRGYWADDPVCVVVDGRPTVFTPHLSGRGGQSYSAPPVPNKPAEQLPPLAP